MSELQSPRIFLSAGEASGDMHAADLAAILQERYPGARLEGLAGPRMVAAGVESLADFDRLVVMGYVELLSRIPFFIGLRRTIRRYLDETRPDLVIPIDYPGFNLWLAREAHERKIPVLIYISPQVWAWRRERADLLAEYADRVAVVFPQEEAFLQGHGVDAVFVGHPLIDHLSEWPDRHTATAQLGLSADRPIVGLLPGSRPQEVERMLPPFLEVARLVQRERPDVQVVVSKGPGVPDELYRPAADYRLAESSRPVHSAATAVLTKSGTSTVEAAIAGTPLVIAHRVHPLTYLVVRQRVHVEHIGMVNILADQRIVPEFVQKLPSSAIAGELLPLLDPDDPRREEMVRALRRVRDSLGEPGAARRVADLAETLLGNGR